MANWAKVNRIRRTTEKYYQANSKKGNIDIPKYDQFVTEVRADWESAGFDLNDPEDVCKLWAALAMTIAATSHILPECEGREELQGAVKVLGTYGNMTALFLREMTKNVDAPAIVFEEDTTNE